MREPLWSNEQIDNASMFDWSHETYYEATRWTLWKMRSDYENELAKHAQEVRKWETTADTCCKRAVEYNNRLGELEQEVDKLRAELAEGAKRTT